MNAAYQELESKLGFDQLRARLNGYCAGALGAGAVEAIQFSADANSIIALLDETQEMMQSLQRGELPPLQYADVRVYFEIIRPEGSFIEEEAFQEIIATLVTTHSYSSYFKNNAIDFPRLQGWANQVQWPEATTKLLSAKFDEQGKLRDSASSELASIRRQLREEESRARRLSEQFFRQAVAERWVPEGVTLTVRDGRVVIPILAEHKRKLKGLIVDESATGQTVFLEPAEVLEANNEIRDLKHAERREVVRILKELTSLLRGQLPGLHRVCDFLAHIDLHRAKARLATELSAVKPQLVSRPALNWINAYHPLLYLSLQGKRKVVPLTIDLPDESRFLLISGPNAGGKSVSLKTVGLLQYMVQCGLPVPMHEESQAGIFDAILIDIGDQQSIDNDLSTYSSHLRNMNQFIRRSTSSTLVLMDELGGGTDPNFGGGIAEAILETLLAKNVWGVATTHYYNLKLFASNRKDIRNAAMQFDTRQLRPLFQLDIGKPGSSFALEIARQTGLPEETLSRAEAIIGKELAGLDTLMKTVAEEKQRILKQQRELSEREKKLTSELDRYRALNAELESRKKEIVNRAKEEASTLLKQTNREIEKTIRHIKENKAERKETRKVRQQLEQLADQVKPITPKIAEKPVLKEGDPVRLIGQDVTGRLVTLKGKQAVVLFGNVRTTVKLEQLVRSDLAEPASVVKARSVGVNVMEKQSSFSPSLDVRGMRAEEVVPTLERFLDDAILLSQAQLKILHGKGEGVLRKVIRDYLKRVPAVASFGDEHVERGGDGITLVVLK